MIVLFCFFIFMSAGSGGGGPCIPRPDTSSQATCMGWLENVIHQLSLFLKPSRIECMRHIVSCVVAGRLSAEEAIVAMKRQCIIRMDESASVIDRFRQVFLALLASLVAKPIEVVPAAATAVMTTLPSRKRRTSLPEMQLYGVQPTKRRRRGRNDSSTSSEPAESSDASSEASDDSMDHDEIYYQPRETIYCALIDAIGTVHHDAVNHDAVHHDADAHACVDQIGHIVLSHLTRMLHDMYVISHHRVLGSRQMAELTAAKLVRQVNQDQGGTVRVQWDSPEMDVMYCPSEPKPVLTYKTVYVSSCQLHDYAAIMAPFAAFGRARLDWAHATGTADGLDIPVVFEHSVTVPDDTITATITATVPVTVDSEPADFFVSDATIDDSLDLNYDEDDDGDDDWLLDVSDNVINRMVHIDQSNLRPDMIPNDLGPGRVHFMWQLADFSERHARVPLAFQPDDPTQFVPTNFTVCDASDQFQLLERLDQARCRLSNHRQPEIDARRQRFIDQQQSALIFLHGDKKKENVSKPSNASAPPKITKLIKPSGRLCICMRDVATVIRDPSFQTMMEYNKLWDLACGRGLLHLSTDMMARLMVPMIPMIPMIKPTASESSSTPPEPVSSILALLGTFGTTLRHVRRIKLNTSKRHKVPLHFGPDDILALVKTFDPSNSITIEDRAQETILVYTQMVVTDLINRVATIYSHTHKLTTKTVDAAWAIKYNSII